MKIFLISTHAFCVVVGAFAAWSVVRVTGLNQTQRPTEMQPIPLSAPTMRKSEGDIEVRQKSGGSFTSDRFSAMRFLRRSGVNISIPFVLPTGELQQAFGAAFDLSPEQMATLQTSILAAREKLAQQAQSSARVTVAPDNISLIAEIPSLPGKGGEVYRELLEAFQKQLGPEKFGCFNEMCGESFDRALDSFGTKEQKFEVTSKSIEGATYLDIKESYVLPDMSGSSGSRLRPEEVSKYMPLLGKLIPPSFGQPKGVK